MKEGGRFWDDVNDLYLPADLVLAARREEIDWVHSEGVYEIVSMQECKGCGHETVGPDLGGHTHTRLWIRHARKFDRGCVQENTKRRSKVKTQRDLPASQFFSAMPLLDAVKVLVSIMMSVSLSNKGKPLKLRHYDISRAHFQGTAQRLIYIKLPAEDRQKYGEDNVGR